MFCLEESRAAGSTPDTADTADTADSICFALSKLPSVACCSKKIIAAGSCSHSALDLYTYNNQTQCTLLYTTYNINVVTTTLWAAHIGMGDLMNHSSPK